MARLSIFRASETYRTILRPGAARHYAYLRHHWELGASEALRLAKAREWAFDRDIEVAWEWDSYGDLSWCECADGSVSHDHDVECASVQVNGETVASLCGIVDAGSPSNFTEYAWLVECELLAEARAECERQAQADAFAAWSTGSKQRLLADILS